METGESGVFLEGHNTRTARGEVLVSLGVFVGLIDSGSGAKCLFPYGPMPCSPNFLTHPVVHSRPKKYVICLLRNHPISLQK